jgi:hypothetical protein
LPGLIDGSLNGTPLGTKDVNRYFASMWTITWLGLKNGIHYGIPLEMNQWNVEVYLCIIITALLEWIFEFVY